MKYFFIFKRIVKKGRDCLNKGGGMMSDGKMSQEDIDRMMREMQGSAGGDDKGEDEKTKEEEKASSHKDLVDEDMDESNKEEAEENKSDAMEKSQLERMEEEKEKLKSQNKEELNSEQKDILGEMANISFGSASISLSELLNKPVNITTPTVEVLYEDEIENVSLPYVVLNVDYVKGLDVGNMLIIEKKVANAIGNLMMGGNGEVDEDAELDEMSISAVQEAMNQMMGRSATAMSELFDKLVDISPPKIKVVEQEQEKPKNEKRKKVVRISFQLEIKGLVTSKLFQVVSIENAMQMVDEMMKTMNPDYGKEEVGLTKEQKDALGEVANISFGSAATSLSEVLNKKVNITTPNVVVVSKERMECVTAPHVVLNVNYIKGLDVENSFIIPKKAAIAIGDLMMGGSGVVPEGTELDEMSLSAVKEAMNQMMGTAATSMSEMFQKVVDITPPNIEVVNETQETTEEEQKEGEKVVRTSFRIEIEDLVTSEIYQLVDLDYAVDMANEMLRLANPDSQYKYLAKDEIDALREMANMSFGAASTTLSEILEKPVKIDTPKLEIIGEDEIRNKKQEHVILNVDYVEGINVENLLMIEKKTALSLSDMVMGGTGVIEDEEKELDEMGLSAVQEVMNQMMGSSATAMSEVFEKTIDISPPSIKLIDPETEVQHLKDAKTKNKIVRITFELNVEGLISSKLFQFISLENAKTMAREMLKITDPEALAQLEEDEYEDYDDEYEDYEEEAPQKKNKKKKNINYKVSPYLDGVDVKVEVIFGNTKRRLKDLLVMEKGQVVSLDEEVDEPLHVYANGVLVAKGEIVNIEGHFGVKIKEMV